MGKIREIALAGTVLLAPQLARAADLLPPPPPIEAPPVVDFSGWYLRGDVGVGSTQSSDWKMPPTMPMGGTSLNESITNRSLTDSSFVSLGVGYQFNNWLRFDLTGEYRGAISARGTYNGFQNSLAAPCTVGGNNGACTLYQDQFNGTIQSTVLMLNAYVDLGTWYGITPFVGAGVGVSRNATKGFTDAGLNVTGTGISALGLPNGASSVAAISPITDKAQFDLAWALMAGLSYEVTPNLKLEIGYRYMDLGTAQTGIINCLCGNTFPGIKMSHLASQDVRVGMRWMIGDYAPPPPPPLVTKY